jgi:hypothetical protein
MDMHHVAPIGPYTLLKYEVGDFFLRHRDTDLSGNNSDNCISDNERYMQHKYTCLIYCPYSSNNSNRGLVGGELVFKHSDGLYDIKFDPAVYTRKGQYVAVIFSIDMFHEVLPVTHGTRYVLKVPLFAPVTMNLTEQEKEEREKKKQEEEQEEPNVAIKIPMDPNLLLMDRATIQTPYLNAHYINTDTNNIYQYLINSDFDGNKTNVLTTSSTNNVELIKEQLCDGTSYFGYGMDGGDY